MFKSYQLKKKIADKKESGIRRVKTNQVPKLFSGREKKGTKYTIDCKPKKQRRYRYSLYDKYKEKLLNQANKAPIQENEVSENDSIYEYMVNNFENSQLISESQSDLIKRSSTQKPQIIKQHFKIDCNPHSEIENSITKALEKDTFPKDINNPSNEGL